MHRGIIINEEDSNIDSVFAQADQEGFIFLRQGDDILIMTPKMASQLCAAYSKFVAKAKQFIGSLMGGSLVFGWATLDLWEKGFYGISIITTTMSQ